jgi:predicted methyltransferase
MSSAHHAEHRSLRQLVASIAASRPAANPDLEQFLMQPDSLKQQARAVAELFRGKRVLFLGDDDHVSVVSSTLTDLQVIVCEVDSRVIESLSYWSNRLEIAGFTLMNCDIREVICLPTKPDAFYANPPFSSKNDGHGLRYWISRGLQLCAPNCMGLIVMPSNGHDWIDHNWLSVQRFVTDNGCRIISTGEQRLHVYDGTTDPEIRSQNLIIRRVLLDRSVAEPTRFGSDLYR